MIVAGFDEVGRGAWAGPLVVAGVSARAGMWPGLPDSKQLTSAQRNDLYRLIVRQATAVRIVWCSAGQIDTFGLAASLRRCFNRAWQQFESLNIQHAYIDGHVNYVNQPQCEAVVRGDQHIPAISAASIVAKHMRDQFMRQLSRQLPYYGFATNVGYGTAEHRQALRHYGYSVWHRRSFRGVKLNQQIRQ